MKRQKEEEEEEEVEAEETVESEVVERFLTCSFGVGGRRGLRTRT